MKKNTETDDVTLIGTNIDPVNFIEYKCVINWYWTPNKSVNRIIENYCFNTYKYDNRILEIGPGIKKFSLATDFIGKNEDITNYTDIDIDKERFPFEDQTFNFVYCRHVLEDIQNPDFAFNEILRVSKSGGYIETPSPIVEITKNVDAGEISTIYCGYSHHRYIVWSNMEKNEIYFLPKYSCILDNIFDLDTNSKNKLYYIINNYPVYWNNYFIYNMKNKPIIIMYKNGINFNTKRDETFINEYIFLVNRAINESIQNTNYFINNYKNFIDK